MDTPTTNTEKHIRQTMREIAETAQKLDDLIRSLGGESRKVPTYWWGRPAAWPDLPWDDVLIANALSATSSLSRILDDPEEEELWLCCEYCHEADCWDEPHGRSPWVS